MRAQRTRGKGYRAMSEATPQDKYTPATRDAIEKARESVKAYKHTHITPEHILLGLIALNHESVNRGFKLGKATPDQIKILVQHHLRVGEYVIADDLLSFSERAKRVIETAREEAQRVQKPQIGPEHLLLGLARVKNTVAAAVLAAVDLVPDAVRDAVK